MKILDLYLVLVLIDIRQNMGILATWWLHGILSSSLGEFLKNMYWWLHGEANKG